MGIQTAPREYAPAPAPPRREQPSHQHWESWALRALLAALVVYQLVGGQGNSATVAAMGLVLSLIPPLISRASHWHVPRALELTFVLAMFLQFGSESLKLFELLTYWDKLVHPAEIFLATGVATFLLLGYRHRHQLDLPDGLAAFGAMLFGMTLGATWELVELALDWFGNANLQKSNADTLTDILTNNAGAVFGALLAFWWYRHRIDEPTKDNLGAIADWLTDRLSRLFMDHGVLVGIVFAAAVGALIFAGWMVDRAPLPAPPAGSGESRSWRFADRSGDASRVAVVLGDWQTDERGRCRVNPERPQPGSEQAGLLALAPGASYGADSGYVFRADALTARPALGAGTAMSAGLAFGLRGPDDYYLLRIDATHDTLRLDRYLHGHRRDVREVRLRTRGDEWHTLQVAVDGDRVTASVDGRPLFEERGVVETVGGIGLWARVSSAGCFRTAEVQPL